MNATMAAIQMSSGDDVIANLETAAQLLREAASGGARLAVLPENFAFMGKHERDKLAVAEADGSGTIPERVAELARALDLWIIPGTLPIRVDGDARGHPSSFVYDRHGARFARYHKIQPFAKLGQTT